MTDAPEGSQGPVIEFVLARGQNYFFVELAEALAHELHALGAPSRLTVGDRPVPSPGLIHVFLPPHEYVTLSSESLPADIVRRSILISAEQPQSTFFSENVSLARDAGAIFDINPRSVRAYRAEGVEASLLELGYSSLWDRFGKEQGRPASAATGDGENHEPQRDIDILFLGRITDRRAAALARYAGLFERFRCHIGLSDNSRPNVATGGAFVAGEDKRDLLARAKVLLNIHADDVPYFEWLRIAEAVCAGCAVVSEYSTDLEPLEWGKHIVTGRPGSLGLLCSWLVEDTPRRELMREQAYELLARKRPLANAARELLSVARQIDSRPIERQVVLTARQERARRHCSHDSDGILQQPLTRPDLSEGDMLALRALKAQQLAMVAMRRELTRLEQKIVKGGAWEPCTQVRGESEAWASGACALSVVVPLYNHAAEVLHALDSLERSSGPDWELVVVDDASTDAGGHGVLDWMEKHRHRPCRLVRHDVNRGLAAARNTGIEHARADRLLMLDADNEVRTIAIPRLMEALDADPDASFSYGIMDRFSSDGPEGLLNCFGWDPLRLRLSNYIDAFALIRRDAIVALEGYSYDPRLYGWEDYDLWVRMAESGRHGVFVPEMIARYRVSQSSMISATNVSTTDAYAVLVDHAPKLLRDLAIPG
ncbi:MAG TPA: glycosyltransferase family 2 protein [Solirubrobacteraceae bacterium]|jgi:hypothetical protein|nr:glycosyltransferase family 2 protein [Solirubrobacteraceae bacterium]